MFQELELEVIKKFKENLQVQNKLSRGKKREISKTGKKASDSFVWIQLPRHEQMNCALKEDSRIRLYASAPLKSKKAINWQVFTICWQMKPIKRLELIPNVEFVFDNS